VNMVNNSMTLTLSLSGVVAFFEKSLENDGLFG
jgi:hypothetical protein